MRYVKMVMVMGLAAFMLAAPAQSRPLAQSTAASSGCTAKPGAVREASIGVTAGKVVITCTGSWSAFQGIQWFSGDASSRGRWSFGGTRTVTGKGNTTIGPWTRPYHGTGWWRQVIRINGHEFIGPVSWLDA